MEPSDPFDPTRVAHLIWTGIITVLGGILHWNWTKLNKDIEKKADQDEMDRRFEELATNRTDDLARQEVMHSENRKRLDDIYQLLVNRKG